MSLLVSFLFNHFWIVIIIVTLINGLDWKSKSKKYIIENPERKESYNKLIKGWLIYANIPWVIMGFGMLTGITNDMRDFFNPSQMNLIVLVFFFSIIFLWLLGSYWIYLKGGAEMLVEHPGFIPKTKKENKKLEIIKVKLLWAMAIVSGIFGLYIAFNRDFPI